MKHIWESNGKEVVGERMSDAFVLSQYRYYGSHLGGRGHDANLISGLYSRYTDEALKRGLIKIDPKTNRYVDVKQD